MSPGERRRELLEFLCRKRQETMKNLAEEFGVSVRTIRDDITELMLSYAQKQGINPSNDLIDGIAHTFLDAMKKGGWFVNLYTNCDFIKSGKFSAATTKSYDVWLADYSGVPDFPCGIQQTGSAGTVSGITGVVDMDVAFKDYPTIIRSGGYNGFPKPQPVNFKCDTTTDISLSPGQAYQFKVTSPQVPTAVIGTQGVASLLPRYRNGSDSFFYLVGFGKSGSAAGIYVNGVKQFEVHKTLTHNGEYQEYYRKCTKTDRGSLI